MSANRSTCDATLALAILLVCPLLARAAAEPQWTGEGTVRVIVEVPPVDLRGRESDEMIASHAIDFETLLREQGLAGGVDLSSIQVHQIDAASGKALPYPKYPGSRSDFDRPCRFDDQKLPNPYPDRIGHPSLTKDGRTPVTLRQRSDRLFNREVLPDRGRIVWVHTQQGQQPQRYAIYFGVQKSAAWQVPPSPWLGDADPLRRAEGSQLGDGYSHFTVTAGDFNGDGLFDILAGTEKGDLMWFPNHGEPGKPDFRGARMLEDEQGPIDMGWYAAPFLFDWNNDGVDDLLVGTSANVILWWKNIGTRTDPKLSYQGFVQADGKRLEAPQQPIAEDPGKIFKKDYNTKPWVGDWDGDGIADVLTGSYITGQISYYRGAGRLPDGTPDLRYVGPLEADGKVIDTVWGAAPFAYDFDGDGKKDLMTGSWFWSGIHRKQEPGEADYLMYFRNLGSEREPRLQREPMPIAGELPRGAIARPTVVQWNADELPDLLVSDSGQVYLFPNVGAPGKPQWDMTAKPLAVPWGFATDISLSDPSARFPGLEQPVFIHGSALYSVQGSPRDPKMVRLGAATAEGQPIKHPGPGYGDPYGVSTLYDWDKDGHVDLLWGTHQGNVYLHRGKGDAGDKGKRFDFAEGVLLTCTNGQPLKVGPPVVDSPDKATDFTILQGSRIIFTAEDFDSDGIGDLVVTDTFAKIWLFRNTKSGGTDTLEPGVEMGKMPTRTTCVLSVDWNKDGKPDLLTEGTAAEPALLFINETRDGKPALAKPTRPFDLPFMYWGPKFGTIDWNGDGDSDVMVRSEAYSFFVEQSFLSHGYQEAKALAVSTRPPPQ